jgi:hypothetical protein
MRSDTRVIAIFSKFERSKVGTISGLGGGERDFVDGTNILATTFAAALDDALGAREALLTIDGFECAASGKLGDWMLDIARRLRRTLVVVARTPQAPFPEQPGTEVAAHELAPLEAVDIQALLEQCLPDAPVEEGLVEVVQEFSAGHAQSVALAAELLQRMTPAERDPERLMNRLRELPPDLATRNAIVVNAIIDRDGGDVAGHMRTCCVLRKFDAELLEALLELEEGTGARAIDDLRRYTFVEPAPDPRGGFFRLHEFIRSELEKQASVVDPEAVRRRHRAAAKQIAAWVAAYEETEFPTKGKSYGAWYRYERPEWRAAVKEWLYHQARGAGGPGGTAERTLGRLRFSRVFLDAFWWWGCYIDFPFCAELLRDWQKTQTDREWTEDLRAFLQAYPLTYAKDDDRVRWQTVADSLVAIQDACDLWGDPSRLEDEERRHVRGLIELFLAHSCRYQATPDEAARTSSYREASSHYDTALELFRTDEDDWDSAWTLFERSELHLEHGARDEARDDWQAAAGLIAGLGDEELAANMHRLAADACWPDDPIGAFAAHGRALLHAYLFQGQYFQHRYRPDAYTLTFYAEQARRTIDRLVEHAQGGGDVQAAVEALQAPLPVDAPADLAHVSELCAAAKAADVAPLIMPRPPDQSDLLIEDSPFMRRWRSDVHRLGSPSATMTGSSL